MSDTLTSDDLHPALRLVYEADPGAYRIEDRYTLARIVVEITPVGVDPDTWGAFLDWQAEQAAAATRALGSVTSSGGGTEDKPPAPTSVEPKTKRRYLSGAAKRKAAGKPPTKGATITKPCIVCGEVMAPWELTEHRKTCSPREGYACPNCPQVLVRPQGFGQHLRSRHGIFLPAGTAKDYWTTNGNPFAAKATPADAAKALAPRPGAQVFTVTGPGDPIDVPDLEGADVYALRKAYRDGLPAGTSATYTLSDCQTFGVEPSFVERLLLEPAWVAIDSVKSTDAAPVLKFGRGDTWAVVVFADHAKPVVALVYVDAAQSAQRVKALGGHRRSGEASSVFDAVRRLRDAGAIVGELARTEEGRQAYPVSVADGTEGGSIVTATELGMLPLHAEGEELRRIHRELAAKLDRIKSGRPLGVAS